MVLTKTVLEIVLEVHEGEEIFFICVSEVLDDVDLYLLSLYLSLRFVGFAMLVLKEVSVEFKIEDEFCSIRHEAVYWKLSYNIGIIKIAFILYIHGSSSIAEDDSIGDCESRW